MRVDAITSDEDSFLDCVCRASLTGQVRFILAAANQNLHIPGGLARSVATDWVIAMRACGVFALCFPACFFFFDPGRCFRFF